ncbi:MAG TPA: helix-turn-helix transcriptional regulator, partial [Dehalococcoidia bacterium]|nr:helix-turn-helix transcriptional regulator [Dehalococcoidia bacterium]
MIQAELARRIGVSQPTVQAWLAGESVPDVATLRKIVADGAFPQFVRLAIAIVLAPETTAE